MHIISYMTNPHPLTQWGKQTVPEIPRFSTLNNIYFLNYINNQLTTTL